MNGTEWTEPGQGATVRQIAWMHGVSNELWTRLRDRFSIGWGVMWGKRTNLRLTGAPLTAEDLERIAKCK